MICLTCFEELYLKKLGGESRVIKIRKGKSVFWRNSKKPLIFYIYKRLRPRKKIRNRKKERAAETIQTGSNFWMLQKNNLNLPLKSNYSGSCLLWSLWDQRKMITFSEWYQYPIQLHTYLALKKCRWTFAQLVTLTDWSH